ncbi:MAG: hypothetical protein R3B53_03795 [Candidatus Paceibacterota bacterium]
MTLPETVQDKDEEFPEFTLSGEAVRVTTGGGTKSHVAETEFQTYPAPALQSLTVKLGRVSNT